MIWLGRVIDFCGHFMIDVQYRYVPLLSKEEGEMWRVHVDWPPCSILGVTQASNEWAQETTFQFIQKRFIQILKTKSIILFKKMLPLFTIIILCFFFSFVFQCVYFVTRGISLIPKGVQDFFETKGFLWIFDWFFLTTKAFWPKVYEIFWEWIGVNSPRFVNWILFDMAQENKGASRKGFIYTLKSKGKNNIR